ncbi:MAG: heavy metal translocating P-type ATPase metal-binding domain-containing protein [Ignavibacteriae bacterium]|nr:heavy metal translocating P-type ATPase metal-binding domain-containing protein [Ignavibacteriota bacterium]
MNLKLKYRPKVVCTHCGEDCTTEIISLGGGEQFCCEGCKIVFELLRDNNLCTYYDLEKAPGISFKFKTTVPRFDYLDSPEIERQLIDFTRGTVSKTTFYLPQMHCTSCLWLLEKLYKLNDGIIASEVNFLRKEVTISFDNRRIHLRSIVELLTKIGYEPEIHLSTLEKPQKDNSQRDLYLKLGLAGFAFGNSMMLSFPEYLSFGNNLDAKLRWFFGILNIILATPVLLYSARDYFTASWHSIRERTMMIDVPIALGILALYIRSVVDILSGSGSGFMDSFTGLIFFLLIGKLFQKKTFETLAFDRNYKSYFPLSVLLKHQSGEKSIPVSSLTVGDVFLVRNNEIIPADGTLLSEIGQIDYSFVTGESEQIEVFRGNEIYAGGKAMGTVVEIQCTKECSQGYLTRLWNNDIFKKEKKSTLLEVNSRFGKWFTIVTIAIAICAGLFWLPVNPGIALNAFTSVLIIACPCALTLAAPFALGWSLTVFGKSSFYLRNASVVLDLAKLNTIVFDKTGTLTEPHKSRVTYTGKILTFEEQRLIQTCLRNSTHPLSRGIASEMPQQDGLILQDFNEFAGLGVEATIDGRTITAGSYPFISGKCKETIQQKNNSTAVYVLIGNQFKGCFEVTNSYRDGLKNLFAALKQRFELLLLTGDNSHERNELLSLFGEDITMQFSQSPEDKLEFIKELQYQGKNVAMIGDGLNDAGALQQSNVGIAVSEQSGSFSPACDAILSSEQLTKLPHFIKFAQNSKQVIIWAFIISVVYNAVGLGFAVSGLLTPMVAAIFMPVSSLSIIGFTTAAVLWNSRKMKKN